MTQEILRHPVRPVLSREQVLVDGVRVTCIKVQQGIGFTCLVPRICERYVEMPPKYQGSHEEQTCMNCRALENCAIRNKVLAR